MVVTPAIGTSLSSREYRPCTRFDVVPLTRRNGALSLGGDGAPVDWLVVMRRLDERFTLERLIGEGRLTPAHLDRVAQTLAHFYRAA